MANYLVSVDSETKELPESVAAALPFSPNTIEDGNIVGDNLILTKRDGSTKDAGSVRGPKGEDGSNVVPTQEVLAAAVGEDGYDVFAILGQSNAVGRGTAIDRSYFDGTYARVWQLANLSSPYADQVIPAADPLHHQEMPGQTVGFAQTFAKHYADIALPKRQVLLVPCAHGDTGFGSTGDYTWRVGQTGPVNLYNLAVAQIDKALALPGSRLAGILWHQGEANNGATAASYRTDLDNLIAALRTRYGATVPFVLGQMSPVKIAAGGGYATIDGVHRDTPNRHAHCAYWGSVPLLEADQLHFSAPGQRINGVTAFKAFQLALGAGGIVEAPTVVVPPSPPAQVTGLTAGAATETTQPLTWTAVSGATSYVVQSKLNSASTWSTVATPSGASTTVSGLTAGTTYDYRVAAVNAAGTGTYSATLTATTYSVTPGFSDSFNRANGNSLGSTDDGKTWEVFSSGSAPTWGITGNAAGYKAGGARAGAVVDSLRADGTLTATIAAIGSAIGGLLVRATDANNYLGVEYRQSAGVNRLQLVKRVGGTRTSLGTSAADKLSAAGSVVGVVLSGTSVSVTLDGTTIIGPVTVSDFAAITKHGLLGDSTDTALLHDAIGFVPSP